MNKSEEACFNIPGGLTSSPDQTFVPKFFTINSKLEDILGLVTHELLHAVKFGSEGLNKTVLPKVNLSNRPKNTWGDYKGEYVINANVSIIHSYLIHYEMDISLNDSLKYELIYQFIQTLRLGKVHGITLKNILQNSAQPLLFKQDTPLFEYIYVRTLILFYYNKISEKLKSCFININKGIEDIFNEPCNFADYMIDILNNQSHSKLIRLLDKIEHYLKVYNTNKELHEREDVCGKAIMNYFCLDPMIIDEDKKLTALYGGKILN
jgi:hypothetical protein